MHPSISPPTSSGIRSSRRRRVALATGAAGLTAVVVAGGYLATSAWFQDTETVTGNAVSTGTLSIGERTGLPLQVEGLLPGQSVDRSFTFTNDGSADFTYSISLKNVVGSSGRTLTPAQIDTVKQWITVDLSSAGDHAAGTLAAPPKLTGIGDVAPGKSAEVDVKVGLSGPNATDDAQGFAATFDVEIVADQKR
ncbi:hypothetical protein JL108_10660 [Aeromicrobium sp. YIM 150415]|uniref:TasA family protein n=1 Tax=Aeromicrobium sp. YIM 150415 TaxID=2803912 RepID=UPI001965AAA8|nr:TasA family protein [Aeromicrobium sp. YIM 150415]MBM9463907.1 hypothetical protein [Aeromicrobium sp. YIM 150415]